jgi:8-oxo-dGTP diphosphatase / 2-hydroxy-dATP diphosphatase
MVFNEDKVLLGMKKRGFGEGRWNGFGGKVEDGESIEEAARRELNEEIGIEAAHIENRGVLTFSFQENDKILEVHIFAVKEYKGDPTETDEMRPQWFGFDEIPYGEMWPDDEYWLPILLDGKKFQGSFLFDRPSSSDYASKIISYELEEIDSSPDFV